MSEIRDERFFYNPIFTSEAEDDDDLHDRTIEPFKGNKFLSQIKTYGDLLDAEGKTNNNKLKAAIRRKLETIHHIRPEVHDDLIIGSDFKEHKFSHIDHKVLYTELVRIQRRDHTYQTKWNLENEELPSLDWDKIWESVYNNFFSDALRSTIWEQIHLNFYTTYNYNKWHNSLHPCPLCKQIPDEIFHIFFHCKFTKKVWLAVENTLLKINPRPISLHEKAFGLLPRTKQERNSTILRNWITFSLRHHIMKEERKAYYKAPTLNACDKFLHDFNSQFLQELKTACILYKTRGLQQKFDNVVTVNDVVASKQGDDDYTFFNIA